MATHDGLLGGEYVNDGGIETDLIFGRGIDLPEFAAFPLLDTEAGRAALRAYFADYAEIAVRAGKPLLVDTATWRASPLWGAKLGYDQAALDRINRESVEFARQVVANRERELVGYAVNGNVGPAGDGYQAAAGSADEYAALHRRQLEAFSAAGADRVTVLTMTSVAEAVGVAWVAADVGLPVGVGFTVETDGRLPDGTPVGEAIAAVDAQAAPAYFLVNCAHPDHVMVGLDGGAWQERVGGLRVNASRLSHAELDESAALDAGDPAELAGGVAVLRQAFPNAGVIGGCCGTDHRHVAHMWGVAP